MKIREQIKDWKNIHAQRVTVKKIKKKKKKKKRKKNQKNVVGKRKKRKKNDGQYEHYFSDFWV